MSELIRKVNRARPALWLFILIGLFVLIGSSVVKKLNQAEANLRSLENEGADVYPVEIQVLEPTNWETWRSYYGQAKSAHTQNVTTYEREIVRTVHVDIGDRVKPGQTLITLAVADRDARVQAQRTGYEEAKLNYNRLKELNAKGGISQSEVDSAYAAMKSAEAQLRSSQSTLQRTEIKASIEGIVSARAVEPGEVAEAGRTLISIVNPRDMEAELMVSKKDIFAINKDTPVEIYVDGVRSEGRVKRVSPEAQTGSGLYPVVVGLPEDAGVLPGAYLEGRFLVSRMDNVIVIPSNIVIYRGTSQMVYVADGDKAHRTEIGTGEGREGRVIVTSGLKAGDELIVSGNRVLYEGAEISKRQGGTEEARK